MKTIPVFSERGGGWNMASYEFAGNHKLDETHTQRDFYLKTITVSHQPFSPEANVCSHR